MNKFFVLLAVFLLALPMANASVALLNRTGTCDNSPTLNSTDYAAGKGSLDGVNLTDNDYATGVTVTVPAAGSGYSPTIDLGGQIFANYYIVNIQSITGAETEFLEVSADNTTFYAVTDFLTASNNTGYIYPYTFRYVRLRAKDTGAPTSGGTVVVREIQLFAKTESCTFYRPKLVGLNGVPALFYYMVGIDNNKNIGLWVNGNGQHEDIVFTPGTTYIDTPNGRNGMYWNPLKTTAGTTTEFPYDIYYTAYNNNAYFAYVYARQNNPLTGYGHTLRISKYDLTTGTTTTVGEFDTSTTLAFDARGNYYVAIASNQNATVTTGTNTTLRFFIAASSGTVQTVNAFGSIWSNGTMQLATNATADSTKTCIYSAEYNGAGGYATPGNQNFTFTASTACSANLFYSFRLGPTGTYYQRTTVKSSGNPNVNAQIYDNATKVVYSSNDAGSGDIYRVNSDGTNDVDMQTADSAAQSPYAIYPVLNGNVWVTYLDYTLTPNVYYKDYFCDTSSNPVLGTSCVCPTYYIFDGNQCMFQGGTNMTNQTFDRVTLLVSDYCESQITSPTCQHWNLFSNPFNNDYVRLDYKINGEVAFNATNGSAYCIGYYNDINDHFDFVWNPSIGQYQAYLYSTPASTFWYVGGVAIQLENIIAHGNTINVACYANSSSYSGDDISAAYTVIGTTQFFQSWNVQTGFGGTYTGSIPSSADKIDIKLSYSVDQNTGSLKCWYAFGTPGQGYGGYQPMDAYSIGATSATWTYTHNNPPLAIGDNRFTLACVQGSVNDPIQVLYQYDKFDVFNSCVNVTSSAKLANFRFVDYNGTLLNYSISNTQVNTKDNPYMRIDYIYTDSTGEHRLADSTKTSCSYVVKNQETGIALTDSYATGILRNDQFGQYYENRLPLSGFTHSGGQDNYTLDISCTSNQCLGSATKSINFSVSYNPCDGDATSCYLNDASNASSGCYSCLANSYNFTCDDGAVLYKNEYSCIASRCISVLNTCNDCASQGHSKYVLKGSLDKRHTTSIDPQITYDLRVLKQNGAEVNIMGEGLSPSCRLFIAPTAGSQLPNCRQFSAALQSGFNTQLCGYEYTMELDSAKNAMTWISPKGLQLTSSQNYYAVAFCTFASNLTCNGFFENSQTFSTGGAGKCPNSAVNLTDGGYTMDGECFAGAKPWMCRITDYETLFKDKQCGCASGQSWNDTVMDCIGDKVLTQENIEAGLTPRNIFLLVLLFPAFVILFVLYIKYKQVSQ